MLKTTRDRIRLISSLLLSVMLLVTGVLLMSACLGVYRIGDRPFTTQNISAAFAKIAVPVFVTLGVALASIVIALIYPAEVKKPRAKVSQKVILARLEAKLDLECCDAEQRDAITRVKKQRLWLLWGTVALCVALAIPALVYALNFSHYQSDYNASIIAACLWMLPFVACALGLSVAYVYVNGMLLDREIALVKLAVATKPSAAPAQKQAPVCHSRLVLGVRIALAVIAAALIVAGIVNGGMADVLYKAINICTECIGLG